MQFCKERGAKKVCHENKGTPNEHFHCEW